VHVFIRKRQKGPLEKIEKKRKLGRIFLSKKGPLEKFEIKEAE